MKRSIAILALTLAAWGPGAKARAGFVVIPGAPFTLAVSNDPSGGNFSGTITPAGNGVPLTFDNGLLTISETITPVSGTSAWVSFDIRTTSGGPIVGNPAANWEIQLTDLQTMPAALLTVFEYFLIDGQEVPGYPFPNFSPATNPITGIGMVGIDTPPPPYTFSTSQTTLGYIDPFDGGGYLGTGPNNTPTGFGFGSLYFLQTTAAPEPASLTLLGLGAAVLGLRAWRKRAP
jgi:hypothetical protein